ncbi:lymphoid-specific helicase [Rhizoctonia solani]|uniref:Lymphoid-specific helicase n=1 Tax=Rhizoctonia solani TaxID=456999 RepID=A0A8H8SZ57_9AGAM|nr:lymphoid-specific helicase [Rhizoctonia solani]QRW23079.1 lymphoid-specific helicase [Rhizoctonia solani]
MSFYTTPQSLLPPISVRLAMKPDSDESVVDDWLVVKGGKILLLKLMSDELLKGGHIVLIFSHFKTVQQWLTHCKALEHC